MDDEEPGLLERLDEFCDNPLIDELDWHLTEGRSVRAIRHGELMDGMIRVDFLTDSGTYSYPRRAGAFRSEWIEAAEVLQHFSSELNLEPLALLSPDLCRQIEPAERLLQLEIDESYARHLLETAERDLFRTIEQASDAFRQKDYRTVVTLLEAVEDRLTGSALMKLQYARTHIG
jgi:hypothetical protein